MYICQINRTLQFPKSPWFLCPMECHIPQWHTRRIPGVLPSKSSMTNTSVFRNSFVGSVWLCTCLSVWSHMPLILWCFSWLMENHFFSGSYALGLAVWREGDGGLLSPSLVLCQVQCPLLLLCWCVSDEACLPPRSARPPSVLCPEPLQSIKCLFEWCGLCWLYFHFCNVTLVYCISTNHWLLFSPFLFFR